MSGGGGGAALEKEKKELWQHNKNTKIMVTNSMPCRFGCWAHALFLTFYFVYRCAARHDVCFSFDSRSDSRCDARCVTFLAREEVWCRHVEEGMEWTMGVGADVTTGLPDVLRSLRDGMSIYLRNSDCPQEVRVDNCDVWRVAGKTNPEHDVTIF